MKDDAPFLPKTKIEEEAKDLLANFESRRGWRREPPIPIEDVVEKHLKLSIDFDDLHHRYDKPRPSSGDSEILGAIDANGSIFIDESLDPEEYPDNEGRYRFTIAHECGHWILHRNLILRDFKSVYQKTMICRSSGGKSRVEWQADYFAACALMPRKLVCSAYERSLLQCNESSPAPGITNIERNLASRFVVSLKAMRIRLDALGLTHKSNRRAA